MTKKSHQKFRQMKIEKFVGKRWNWEKFSRSPKKFSEIGGKSETGGECIIVSGGMDARV